MYYKPKSTYLKIIPLRREILRWKSPIPKADSFVAPNSFVFLNYFHTLPNKGGWNDASLEKLWIYNLHYFDDLNSENEKSKKHLHEQLIHRWILENPPSKGVGWDPYPTSLRMVNWIKWALNENDLSAMCAESLYNQARWLMKRVEWHLLGNHLFTNAKALVFAGVFFKGNEANKWLKKGISIIHQQLCEQILKDGGHFELSPMYHAIFLEDILDLINILQSLENKINDDSLDILKSHVNRMLNWLSVMIHPDGDISFFNDAALKIAPRLSEIIEYTSRLQIDYPASLSCDSLSSFTSGVDVKLLQESGYIRLKSSSAVSILDVATIGPDYLPGHGHADVLSFELSIFNKRVIVNSGTFCYQDGKERQQLRQTSAHSTVEINNESSSEVWGSFRVGRRAYPFDLKIKKTLHDVEVACSHDGYQRFPSKPVHHRVWKMTKSQLKIYDEVSGVLPAISRYILHPTIQCFKIDESQCELRMSDGKIAYFASEIGEISVIKATYYPEFGKKVDTQAIIVKVTHGKAISVFSWN